MHMNNKNASNNKYLDILNAMQAAHVLVVGDSMLDRFVYGYVERISPESPVPVLSIKREEYMCGGAGNALANLAGLGVKGQILSVIGSDDSGKTLKSLVKDMGFDASGLLEDTGRVTTEKTRFLAGHQQLLRTDYERNEPLASYDEFFEYFDGALENANALLISDYGKMLLSKDVLKTMIEKAQAKDIPVIVDPKGKDFSIYAGASAITPNKKELSEATGGASVETDEQIETAAAELIQSCDIGAVIATRSKQGISVIEEGKDAVHIDSAGYIEVFDVSGAGDTVIATISACLAAGGTLGEAAYIANLAGHIAVTKVGTAPIRLEELIEAVQEKDVVSSSPQKQNAAAFVDLSAAKEQVQRWRAKGLSVGFTNGCFDILHAGHVQYLQEARKHCDRLVIGLNKDISVRILKGSDRPVHNEQDRATVLSSLAAVDLVVLFGAEQESEDNTASAVIEDLKPDVYFKGGDYKVSDIPEAPSVQSYGGEVKIMSEVMGQSTTGSIHKIKKNAA